MAANANPKNSDNWSTKGYICQSLSGFIPDSETCSTSSYDQAIAVDPNNPYFFTQEGEIYLSLALKTSDDQTNQKNQYLSKAQTQLEKAVSLKSDYSDALYYLGLTYDSLGQKDKAIKEFNAVLQLNPDDKTIPKILSNLNAGLPALQTQNLPVKTPPGSGDAVKNTPVSTPASSEKTSK